MNNSNPRISKEVAADVLALASRLYAQKSQDYSLAELTQVGEEVNIPPELIQQALQQISQAQTIAHERQQKLKLILISSITGALTTLGSLWAYNMLNTRWSQQEDSDVKNTTATTALIPPPAQPLAPPESYGTSFSGKVERYLLNPEGLVDGLILSPNLQVKFPPHMANSLVATVQLGENVTVVGNPGIASNIGQEIRGFSITNTRTKRTILNQPPLDLPPAPRKNYSNLSVEGTPQYWLVGHRGEINGVILSSGAQVRFPPHVGYQVFSTAKRGDLIQAQGFGSSTNYGQVLAATSLITNGQSINFYPDNPPGKRHKRPL